ncbi:hypothetical protein FNV43_RR25377 [Rhamnella rubrinervis]|uniref:Cupin type-1 domain-containing protein n=1 Tax=Rhamnella rubrinervis TaxID=2594499 RepID=A0A8K0GQ15_9ROSA|nr:hypothetical protein FNV43_RR25377 [Rhamnella rubrinervis]
MYVAAHINNKDAQAMVDTGASHNFIKREEAMRLGLKLEKGQGRLKTMNTEARPLDEFFKQFNVIPLLHYNAMCIMEGDPCMISTMAKPSTNPKRLSDIQLEKELGGDVTHIATFCKDQEADTPEEIPREMGKVFEEFKDVMTPELPKKLPPSGEVDHKLEDKPDTSNMIADVSSGKVELASTIGLIHFQLNPKHDNADAFAALSSQNPRVITIANAVFGSEPRISPDVLTKAFQFDENVIDYLQMSFWVDNNYDKEIMKQPGIDYLHIYLQYLTE